MAETIDNVSERLTKLEVTVAKGFHDMALRFHDSESRDLTLTRKIDIAVESLRADVKIVLEAVGSLAAELRETRDSIRHEHSADRAVITTVLEQHGRRIHDLETR